MKKTDIERNTKAANDVASGALKITVETCADMSEECGVIVRMESVHNEKHDSDSNAEMEEQKRHITVDNWGEVVMFVGEKRMEVLCWQLYNKIQFFLIGNGGCGEDGEKMDIDPASRARMNLTRLGTSILKVIGYIKSGIEEADELATEITVISRPMLTVIAVIRVLVVNFATLWNTNEEFRDTATAIWKGIYSKISAFFYSIRNWYRHGQR